MQTEEPARVDWTSLKLRRAIQDHEDLVSYYDRQAEKAHRHPEDVADDRARAHYHRERAAQARRLLEEDK
jgi:hypothetical protein